MPNERAKVLRGVTYSLHILPQYLKDACHPAPIGGRPINRRALSERSELARPPVACVRHI